MNDYAVNFGRPAVTGAFPVCDVALVPGYPFDFMLKGFTMLTRIIPVDRVEDASFNVLLSPVYLGGFVVVGAPRSIGHIPGALGCLMDEAEAVGQ